VTWRALLSRPSAAPVTDMEKQLPQTKESTGKAGGVGTGVDLKDHLLWRLKQKTYRDALALGDMLMVMANIDGAKHTRKEGLCRFVRGAARSSESRACALAPFAPMVSVRTFCSPSLASSAFRLPDSPTLTLLPLSRPVSSSMCIWVLNLVGLSQNSDYCDTVKVSAHGDDIDALHEHYTDLLNQAFELNTTGLTYFDDDGQECHIPVKVQFCCNGRVGCFVSIVYTCISRRPSSQYVQFDTRLMRRRSSMTALHSCVCVYMVPLVLEPGPLHWQGRAGDVRRHGVEAGSGSMTNTRPTWVRAFE